MNNNNKGDTTMKQVTKDMNIREMVMMDEGIAQILMSAGMHCLGCMMSHFENLEQACAVHGIDADALVDEINEYLEAKGE
jgi:hybrid cluster-associated redox disulfide protein